MIGEDELEDQSIWVSVPTTADADQSTAVKICVSLRQLQRRRGCSNVLLQDLLQTMRPYLRCLGPRCYTAQDKQMQKESGVVCLQLHGCSNCDDFVFPPDDETMLRCPKCDAERYIDAEKKTPKEMVYYFPIAGRLKALLKVGKFDHSVNYELWRRSNPSFMTDLQDSPAWQEEMGPLPNRGKYLLVLVCDVCFVYVLFICYIRLQGGFASLRSFIVLME